MVVSEVILKPAQDVVIRRAVVQGTWMYVPPNVVDNHRLADLPVLGVTVLL